MVHIAGNYDTNAEPSSRAGAVPAGTYRAAIIDSELQDISKNNDLGQCLTLTWKIEGGDCNGQLFWQRLNMFANNNMKNAQKVVEIANQQFAAIRHATGKINVMDSNELHHIPCDVRVAVRLDPNGQYDPQNEVKAVSAVGGASNAPAQNRPNTPVGQTNTAPRPPVGNGQRPAFLNRQNA